MKIKEFQFNIILTHNNCKAIYLLLIFVFVFQLNSNAQYHRVDSIPVVDLGPNGNVCDNEPRLLNAYNVGCTYEWKFNDSIISDSSFIYASKGGTYSVKVISSDSIEAFDTIKLKLVFSPVFGITANKSFEKYTIDFSVEPFIQGILYLWDFNDPTSGSNSSQLRSPTHKFSSIPNYVTVKLTSVITGCSKIDTFWDVWLVLFYSVNNTPASLFNVKVFPNPISENSSLSFTTTSPISNVSARIVDIQNGTKNIILEDENYLQGEHILELNKWYDQIEAGFYLLELIIDEIPTYTKIVKLE